MDRSTLRSLLIAALALLSLLLLSLFSVHVPPKAEDAAATDTDVSTEVDAAAPGAGDPNAPAAADQGAATGSGPDAPGTAAAGAQRRTRSGAADSGQTLQCRRGQNGGPTDRGVSEGKIKLAATNVRSGTGSSFLGSSFVGMQAVVNRVNAKGGICGRLLELRLVDDGWNAATGAGYLATFAKEDYFALPVVPSSEGLTTAIENRTISNAQIPVVGSDGMLKAQYFDPWVWPVATSTVTTMRVMAKHAYDEGSRTFGIVYDERYKFGIEGAAAFRDFVKTLPGASLAADVPLTPQQPNYSGKAKEFADACAKTNGCEFVAMLLTPETAATYIASQREEGGRKVGFGTMSTAGAQPLFNERFARDCGRPCDGMLVWTGYNPPVGSLASLPGVAEYINDVKSVDPSADVSNQFLQGAYLGMRVFAAALEKVGPRLTREAVRDAMNSMTYQSDLSSTLTWSATSRFANQSAQAFQIVTTSGSFAGFAETGTGFLKDPMPGVVPKS